jgi:NAD(P)-dependent dehydrogenase (short-subunit alcohol dehydrogenase family)
VVDFAKNGANVVASGRREDRGAELVEETQGLPGDVIFVRADVTVAKDVENLMSSAVSEFGRIDYAFNNAGGFRPVGRLHEYSDEDWDHYSDTFLKSVWRCMKHEIEHMLPNQSGVIINNASVAGLVGVSHAAYVATKHGVVGLTKAATKEYAGEGLRFNAVCPGWIDTEMTAGWKDDLKSFVYSRQSVKRPGESEEVAALVRWMCSEEAAFVSGVAWAIDGGLTAGL